jgi:polyhydroxybutyrate depolymerase
MAFEMAVRSISPRARFGGAACGALAVLLAACGNAPSVDPCAGKSGVAGTRQVTIHSGGIDRTFLLTAPPSALQGRPVPLVVVYHGVTSTGQIIQLDTRIPEKAAAEGFITAAGDGVGRSWNAGVCCDPASTEGIDDVGFTRDMVAAIEAEYCIDPARVYATGHSNGAAMVFRLACEASDLFAAFAPVSGSLAVASCDPGTPRPIDIINSVSDPIVPYVLGQASFARFLTHNTCSAAREESHPASTTTCEAAPECAGGATTEFCSVTGLAHQWPGAIDDPNGPFDATDAIWEFFSRS